MAPLDADPAALETFLESRGASIDPDLTGPFRVVSVSRGARGTVSCELTAYRLVPVEPADPALRDVSVAVPVAGRIELAADGSILASSLPAPGADEVRQARAHAKDRIEQGSVRGITPASVRRPPGRPTHELRTEAGGRRVIRRIGFDAR
jgi:hypothetical protein